MFEFKKFLRANFSELNHPAARLFLVLLISTILLHLVAWIVEHFNGNWVHGSVLIEKKELLKLGTDGGYPEHLQYILLFWCFLLSWICVYRFNLKEAFVIPGTYLFLFLDDSLSFHDYLIGPKLINLYQKNLFSENSYQDLAHFFAEITFWAIIVVLIMVFSLKAILSKNQQVLKFIVVNFIFFVLLAFFGIFIDGITPIISRLTQGGAVFHYLSIMGTHVLEEVGELLAVALACCWLFGMAITEFTEQQKNMRTS